MSNTYQVRDCSTGTPQMVTITRFWSRYTPPNPYTNNSNFTIDDFNMRRKAEILQYRNESVRDSTFTLNSQFSRLVNGNRFTNRANPNVCEFRQLRIGANIQFNTVSTSDVDPNWVEAVIIGINSNTNEYTISYDSNEYPDIPASRLKPMSRQNIQKPSSASNVPGRRMLFFNSKVPLTRFGAPLRTFRADS